MKTDIKMQVSNKWFFYLLLIGIMIIENILIIVVIYQISSERMRGTSIFLTCGSITSLTSAIMFSQGRQEIVGSFMAIPITLVTIFVDSLLISNRDIFHGRSHMMILIAILGIILMLSIISFISGGLIHIMCRTLDSLSEANLFARVRITMFKSIYILGISVVIGIPVISWSSNASLSFPELLTISMFMAIYVLFGGILTALCYQKRVIKK